MTYRPPIWYVLPQRVLNMWSEFSSQAEARAAAREMANGLYARQIIVVVQLDSTTAVTSVQEPT